MKTLIIGGGLSGLALARQLEAQGSDYKLVEARARFGGRILSEHHGEGYYDMGPAWFWPGQPRIDALINTLGLARFEQFSEGALTFEDAQGQVQRGRGFASMQGSWRLKGGLGALIDALEAGLPEDRKHLNAQVTALEKTTEGIAATLSSGQVLHADRVVLSLPPRIAAGIAFTPALPPNTLQAMQQVSTWMAGQAKAVAVYDQPFWRDMGLSGDAQSRFGPMVEIHDASPETGGPYALFGFIGIPAQHRADTEQLRAQTLAQLARLFGPLAGNPTQMWIKDWAYDAHTATDADHAPLHAHPHYGMSSAFSDLWDNTLVLSGTEVAPQFGGYLEGALEAAENTLSSLNATEK